MAAKRPMEAGTAREAKYGATAAVYVIVIIAVLVMINWLANRYNKTVSTQQPTSATRSPNRRTKLSRI